MATKEQKEQSFFFAKSVIEKAAEGGSEVARLDTALQDIYEAALKIKEDIDNTSE